MQNEEEMRHHHDESRGEQCDCGGHGQEHHEEECQCGEHHGQHQGGMGHQHHGVGYAMLHPGCDCPGHVHGMIGGFPRMGMMGRMGMMHGQGMAPWRHFVSREEIVTKLDEYLKQLQMETKAVQERIETIKKHGEQPQA